MIASLVVVGTGIMSVRHVTREAETEIRKADRVFYVSVDPVTESWLRDLNPAVESLATDYQEGRPRQDAYAAMVRRIIAAVRRNERVCVALYGHPGAFARVGHEAIRVARSEGYRATMQPGISAEDCLIADLGVDPGRFGLQSAEATYFLDRQLRVEPRMALVLWQVGLLGQRLYRSRTTGIDLQPLADYLSTYYDAAHEAIIYEAATHPIAAPSIERVTIERLNSAAVTWMSTLYVPPAAVESSAEAAGLPEGR